MGSLPSSNRLHVANTSDASERFTLKKARRYLCKCGGPPRCGDLSRPNASSTNDPTTHHDSIRRLDAQSERDILGCRDYFSRSDLKTFIGSVLRPTLTVSVIALDCAPVHLPWLEDAGIPTRVIDELMYRSRMPFVLVGVTGIDPVTSAV
jgi:hypothetical protein